MSLLRTVDTQCPYCGELIELVIDGSLTEQEYIEDCSVCCQPINLKVVINQQNNIELSAKTDND